MAATNEVQRVATASALRMFPSLLLGYPAEVITCAGGAPCNARMCEVMLAHERLAHTPGVAAPMLHVSPRWSHFYVPMAQVPITRVMRPGVLDRPGLEARASHRTTPTRGASMEGAEAPSVGCTDAEYLCRCILLCVAKAHAQGVAGVVPHPNALSLQVGEWAPHTLRERCAAVMRAIQLRALPTPSTTAEAVLRYAADQHPSALWDLVHGGGDPQTVADVRNATGDVARRHLRGVRYAPGDVQRSGAAVQLARLCDARVVQRGTAQCPVAHRAHSPGWAPPEEEAALQDQLRGGSGSFDAMAGDVFAAGVVMLQVLTATPRLPWQRASADDPVYAAFVGRVSDGAPDSQYTRRPADVSVDTWKTVLACLAPSPQRRPTARDAHAVLSVTHAAPGRRPQWDRVGGVKRELAAGPSRPETPHASPRPRHQ